VNRRHLAAVAALLFGAALPAFTQRPNRGGGMGGRGQGGVPDQQRSDLEDEVRRMFARAVRERVGLSDDQMVKLGPITRKFEEQRRETQRDERDVRTKLQGLVMVNSESDSVRIRQMIAQMSDLRRRRFQIDEAEQKDLAGIMTPLQLAKFMAIQEQVRRRLEQMRPGGPGPGNPMDGSMPVGRNRPPSAESPDAELVTLRIRVVPLRATIYVDDQMRGTGATIVNVSPGWRRIRAEAPGCAPFVDSVQVARGQPPYLRTIPNCT
jgi:hypothetical protein